MSDYNPRTGHYGGAPFANTGLADKLRQLREYIHTNASPSAALSTLFNMSPMGAAIQGSTQGDILNDHKIGYVSAGAPAAPSSAPTPLPPVQPLDDAPQRGVTGFDMATGVPMPRPRPQMPPQAAPVPMPQARPAAAPQAQPDTSFFMRNALMMRDPSTNQLIDPSGASQVRGPDLINKMMGYLHDKKLGASSVGNNNDPSTWGSG